MKIIGAQKHSLLCPRLVMPRILPSPECLLLCSVFRVELPFSLPLTFPFHCYNLLYMDILSDLPRHHNCPPTYYLPCLSDLSCVLTSLLMPVLFPPRP